MIDNDAGAVQNIQECFHDGEPVSYVCPPIFANSVHLVWRGAGFGCPNTNQLQNNLITFSHSEDLPCPETRRCGTYTATITCIEGEPISYSSTLKFFAPQDTMNTGIIYCEDLSGAVNQNFSLRVGGKISIM